ncbi:MAG: sugar ABC transporter permease [Chloroflexi bacterium]|nr:MAG: sugar ABC transporter permease [Chloroflexota bacterium]
MQIPARLSSMRRRWGGPRMTRLRRAEFFSAYGFLAPFLIILITFTVIAGLVAFGLSFFKLDLGFTPPEFAGLHNYQIVWYELTHNGDYLAAVTNGVKYAIMVVFAQTVVALALALLLNQKIRGRSIFRTVFFLPSLTSSVAMSLIFLWLYNDNGAINYVLSLVGISPHNWLNDTNLALPSIAMLAIWSTAPTMMLFYLAALQDIPESLLEAARVDGANTWQTIWHITIPLLRPVTFVVVVLGSIGAFQAFDQVYIMQGPDGGPLNSTITPVLQIYNSAFRDSLWGLACAQASILFIAIFTIALLERRFIDANIQY